VSRLLHRALALTLALTLIALSAGPASAHPLSTTPGTEGQLASEIADFRKAFQAAAQSKDVAALRRFYTEAFTHTHTSGKVDNKDARIVSVLAGEPTVEMAPVPEFNLNCFGSSVCIVRALSPIKRASDGKWFDVRWTQTYIRSEATGWQIAISQATGLLNTVRENP
jgi:hypothetical protein